MCEPGKGSEPRSQAGAVKAPRPAQPRGPCVALPSQGSQERAAEKTLAGGVSGCWENGFKETVPSKPRPSRGGPPSSLPDICHKRRRYPRRPPAQERPSTPEQVRVGRAGARRRLAPPGSERPGLACVRPEHAR